MKIQFIIKDLAATKKIAKLIANLAQPNMFLLLNGSLGVGKTQLTKFIAEELDVKVLVTSPTFNVMNLYKTKFSWQLVHIDAYRLACDSSFNDYWEYAKNNFTIIEWASKLKSDFYKQKTIQININFNSENRELNMLFLNFNSNELMSFKNEVIKFA